MFGGDPLPGTVLSDWMRRVQSDPAAVERTQATVALLLRDPVIAERVRAGLAARAAAADDAILSEVVRARLRGFLRDGEGALHLDLRLGAAAARVARLRRWVFAGASATLAALAQG